MSLTEVNYLIKVLTPMSDEGIIKYVHLINFITFTENKNETKIS